MDLLLSYLDSTITDHGIFRLLWKSWGKLSKDMYRSNQPYPFQIDNNFKKYNIKTIINLRGERHCSSYYLEKKYCNENNINLINFPISSRDLPSFEKISALCLLFDKIKYPALMHCKSGADRVGIASVIYSLYVQKKSISIAKKQLSLRHLHIRYAKTGMLDFFFESALKDNAKTSKEFFKWAKNQYDKESLKKKFNANRTGNFIIDYILKRE